MNTVVQGRGEGPAGLVGVIGGMGPLATADFYRHVVRASHASRDQDHVPMIIWADPRIPDRSDAIIAGGPDPTLAIRAAAQTLVAAGANQLVVACNTAHVFLEQALAGVDAPLTSLIAVAADAASERAVAGERIAILGTDGTLASGVYQEALAARGLAVVVPDARAQTTVMRSIRSVKAGDLAVAVELLRTVVAELRDQGATTLLAACTDLPEVLASAAGGLVVLDPMERVAAQLVASYEARVACRSVAASGPGATGSAHSGAIAG